MQSKEEIQKEFEAQMDEIKEVKDLSKSDAHQLSNLVVQVQLLRALIDLRDVLAAVSADLSIIRDQGEH